MVSYYRAFASKSEAVNYMDYRATLMRFISFASNIGPAAAVPAGPAPAPLKYVRRNVLVNVLVNVNTFM